jgi:putative two-component system response regulator
MRAMLISDLPDAAAPLVLLAGAAPEGAAALLREAHYRVRSAPTAAALLRLAGSEPGPQLILLGDSVGGQPGMMLLARLQDHAAARGIPVLLVADGADEELALALGAADCLSLPLRPLVLLARVQAQLRLAALAEAA